MRLSLPTFTEYLELTHGKDLVMTICRDDAASLNVTKFSLSTAATPLLYTRTASSIAMPLVLIAPGTERGVLFVIPLTLSSLYTKLLNVIGAVSGP